MSQTDHEQTFRRGAESARPSTARLRAWPSLAKAAEMLGLVPSTLSRAVDARDIAKYSFGRRDKKLAPDAVLDLALVYNANVNDVADQLMDYGEQSGAEASYLDSMEETIGSWFAGQARKASLEPGDLEALIDAVRELSAPAVAEAILARAGVTV